MTDFFLLSQKMTSITFQLTSMSFLVSMAHLQLLTLFEAKADDGDGTAFLAVFGGSTLSGDDTIHTNKKAQHNENPKQVFVILDFPRRFDPRQPGRRAASRQQTGQGRRRH
jgi:hypothetical protein